MRFVTFHLPDHTERRFGLCVGETHVADIERATAARLAGTMPPRKAVQIAHALTPAEAVAFIAGGEWALAAARETLAFCENAIRTKPELAGPDGHTALFSVNEIELDAPVPNPDKCIAAGKNFVDHAAEMASAAPCPNFPVAFGQFHTTFAGPDRTIPIPFETIRYDYEVEVAVVIGKPAYRIEAETALDHVFGYTIFNDLSARDLYRNEQAVGIPTLGKNLADAAPMGPHLVTADEVADWKALALTTRVNGEVRQNSTLANMLFGIPELIAWWSQIGLEPGDIVTTGTPAGVAAGRKPGEKPWWIRPGDVVETEVSTLGVLRTTFA